MSIFEKALALEQEEEEHQKKDFAAKPQVPSKRKTKEETPKPKPQVIPVSHISMGTENLEIRLRVSDYALVQSLVVDGRRRLEVKGFQYNERQMLWGMAIALSSHLDRALSDQELVGTSWLDSRMIRWAVEYGYLQTKANRSEANQAQELLSKVTGQTKRVRPELKVPVSLQELNASVKAAGKEKDLGDLDRKMEALESWIMQIVIPNLQAKAGLEAFA